MSEDDAEETGSEEDKENSAETLSKASPEGAEEELGKTPKAEASVSVAEDNEVGTNTGENSSTNEKRKKPPKICSEQKLRR